MKFEKIKLSNHARKRMRQRNIPRSQILRTLNEPERVYPSGGDSCGALYGGWERDSGDLRREAGGLRGRRFCHQPRPQIWRCRVVE